MCSGGPQPRHVRQPGHQTLQEGQTSVISPWRRPPASVHLNPPPKYKAPPGLYNLAPNQDPQGGGLRVGGLYNFNGPQKCENVGKWLNYIRAPNQGAHGGGAVYLGVGLPTHLPPDSTTHLLTLEGGFFFFFFYNAEIQSPKNYAW